MASKLDRLTISPALLEELAEGIRNFVADRVKLEQVISSRC